MIWDRERYIAHCNFEFTGREMFCELFGLLIGLEEEWQRQGASAKEILRLGLCSQSAACGQLRGNHRPDAPGIGGNAGIYRLCGRDGP